MPTETVITPHEALGRAASLIATCAQMADLLRNTDAGPGAGPLG